MLPTTLAFCNLEICFFDADGKISEVVKNLDEELLRIRQKQIATHGKSTIDFI